MKLQGQRPNILLILVDEQRYPVAYETEALRAFRRDQLPAQEHIRRHAVEFHRHYTASAACSPSRASLFTGHYPSLHGVTQTAGMAKRNDDPAVHWLAPDTVPTLGDYFRAAGYRTYYKGKWPGLSITRNAPEGRARQSRGDARTRIAWTLPPPNGGERP